MKNEPKPDDYENFDLSNIITPMKVETFIQLLTEAGYDQGKTEFLRKVFTEVFDIRYQGPERRTSTAKNIPLKVGSKTELWNKIMKEVRLKRVAGPFNTIPFEHYIQSLIGLIPKAGNNEQRRLIFHLSYDFDNDREKSLNFSTPREECSIKYNNLDPAVKAYLDIQTRNLKRKPKTHLVENDLDFDDDSDETVYASKIRRQKCLQIGTTGRPLLEMAHYVSTRPDFS